MTYTIQINEHQRAALLQLLQQVHRGGANDPTPLQYWVGALRNLPDDERDNPGALHGLCL